MAAVDTVFEQLGSMTVLELVELKKKIEDEWGITAAAPVAFAVPGGGGGDAFGLSGSLLGVCSCAGHVPKAEAAGSNSNRTCH